MVMTAVTSKLYELQSEEAKEQETEVSYGTAYTLAAKKTAGLVSVDLTDQQASKAGTFAALRAGRRLSAALHCGCVGRDDGWDTPGVVSNQLLIRQ